MGVFCRCRLGHFHVVNNEYTSGWGIYTIGGSEDPTILSEGNHFYPAAGTKQVTKRISDSGSNYRSLNSWNWKSVGDVFLRGSYFLQSGPLLPPRPCKPRLSVSQLVQASLLPQMTQDTAPLVCHC